MNDTASYSLARPTPGASRRLVRGVSRFVGAVAVLAAPFGAFQAMTWWWSYGPSQSRLEPGLVRECWGCESPLYYVAIAFFWTVRLAPFVAPVVAFVFGVVRRDEQVMVVALVGGLIIYGACLYGQAITRGLNDWGPLVEVRPLAPGGFWRWLLTEPPVDEYGRVTGSPPLVVLILGPVATTLAAAAGVLVGLPWQAVRRG